MSKATLQFIMGLLILGAGIFVWTKQSHVLANIPPNYVWSFSDAGTNNADVPQTKVTLLNNGTKYVLGNVDGTCATIDESSWNFLDNEVSGAICYFAGAGTEFGIFRVDGIDTMQKGIIDEGDAETSGTRGDFHTLFSL